MTLQELVNQFPTVHLASPEDNGDILDLIAKIPMQTTEGGLSFSRAPHFFALTKAQGEASFTFLFRNGDGSLGGVGCVSIMPMQVAGEDTYVGYTSDLRLSPRVDRQTRKEFYVFYEKLIFHFPEIHEFMGCRHVFATIYDGNTAAKRALVTKRKKHPSALEHQPFHAFHSINVVGRIPPWRPFSKKNLVEKATAGDEAEIMALLTETQSQQQISWSEAEVRRRLQVMGKDFSDFLLIRDEKGAVIATCLLGSDQEMRQVKVTTLPRAVRWSRPLLSWAGQPEIRPQEPLRIGHLTLCKSRNPEFRGRSIRTFLNFIFDEQAKLPVAKRWHSITFQEPQKSPLLGRLRRQGFLATPLASTLYQVRHQAQSLQEPLAVPKASPDFDMIFH